MKLIRRRVPLFALLAATVVSPQRAQAVPFPSPEIVVLSNRADLISGGDALVEMKWPSGSKTSHARVALGDVDVSSAFSWRADGRYIGLVTGLRNGPNVLTAHVPGAMAQIVITNHPITGPVVSGPQIEPYECRLAENGLGPALDADCSAATVVKYFYRGSAGCSAGATACFKPLADPTGARPADLLTTTTNTGVTVPYIVRLEVGTINRGVYRLAMLEDPGVAPFPGPGWNQKLVMQFNCCGSAQYNQGVLSDASALSDTDLSRGFAFVNSTEMWNQQHANAHLQGETAMMIKEYFIEHVGMPKWTVGVGGSGGAIQQYLVAELYPGLLDGLQPGQSFPDSMMPDVTDCRLLNKVWKADPVRWATAKRNATQGFNSGTCNSWDLAFASIIKSDNVPGCGLTDPANIARIYNPVTNPTGDIRCDMFQTNVNLLGKNASGRAYRPIDNVGVQYGLAALNAGQITVEDFVALNEQVGGYDQDGNTRAARSVADPEALLPTYEGGLRNSFTGEAQYPIPIITQRTNASGTGDIHDTMQDLIIRAKLQRAQGRADNQIIWTSSTQAAVAGVNIGALSIDVMNEWLDRIAADPSPRSFDKVARNKPASGLATDACWDKSGNRIAEPASTDAAAACNLIYPRFSTVRLIAGVPLAHDEVKCQLTPVDFSGYAVSFTAEQQARLRAVFPDGVCDWSKLSLDQVTANTWTAYVDGFGFMPLPDPPVSVKHVSDNR